MKYPICLLLAAFTCASSLNSQNKLNYPPTKTGTVIDTYFGTEVPDPYRWLEDDRSAETGAWVQSENAFTNSYFASIPFREKVKKRLTEIWNYNRESAPFKKGAAYFSFKNNGLQNQSVLFIKKNMSDAGTVLLDPNTLSADGTSALSGLSISKDGKYLAYGVSKAGSDWVEVHFMEIATKKTLPDVLNWVKFSGLAWQGHSLYYSRYAEPKGSALSQKNTFHKVYKHQVGTQQAQDELIFEDKEHSDYNFGASLSDDEKYLFISTSQSTSGEMLRFKDLTRADSKFKVLSDNFNADYSVVGIHEGKIYVLTSDSAPNNKLVAIDPVQPGKDKWQTILVEQKSLLESVHFFGTQMLANYLEDVSSKLYCYTPEGKLVAPISLPGICRVNTVNAEQGEMEASISCVQFTAPERVYSITTKDFKPQLVFSPTCAFASDDYETKQVKFKSKDGTLVPMFITHKKGLVLGPNTPCFVYGYGGFNISIAPEFRVDRTLFLEAGGIYCVPSLRGGGEFGEEWHTAGTKCNKQNVFDDFIAACDYLVANNMTSYQKIAIHGRSNGGLLAAAVLTQRPDICKVAIPAVGVLDMLRFHQFTIGRAWTVDYGCSENKNEFDCLYKYSPLHNIKKIAYPATLVLTGDHDDRVVPAHSFKFAATLQANTTGAAPCLIRIDVNAGHGAGKPTSKQIEEFTDMWSFVMQELGMSY